MKTSTLSTATTLLAVCSVACCLVACSSDDDDDGPDYGVMCSIYCDMSDECFGWSDVEPDFYEECLEMCESDLAGTDALECYDGCADENPSYDDCDDYMDCVSYCPIPD